MERNYKLDNIRAIAIISVVFGHSIILYSSQWGLYETSRTSLALDYVKRFINIYQMPLFFSLSGYLFAMTWKKKSFGAYIMNKLKRLIVPFFVIGMLWMIPIKMAVHYPYYENMSYIGAIYAMVNGSDSGHLWYLPTLFAIFLIMYCITNLFGSYKVTYIFLLGITLILNILHNYLPTFGVAYISYIYQYIWSFVLGSAICCMRDYKCKKSTGAIPILLMIVTSVIYIIYTKRMNSVVTAVAILSCLYVIVENQQNAIAAALSKNSFGMYLFHSPLIYITFTYFKNLNPIIVVALNFVVFGGIAYVLTELIRKTPMRIVIGE